MSNIFTMTTVLAVLVVAVLLPKWSEAAVTDTDCSDGGSECTDVDANSECVSDKCACVTNYRQNPATDTECIAVLDSTCTQGTDCSATVNSGCTDVSGSMKCTCNDGYKTDTNMCTKVITGPCAADSDCTATVANSKCTGESTKTCSCDSGYKEISDVCEKVLGYTCANDGECTALLTGTECKTDKCQCISTTHTTEDNICKTALGQTCDDTTVCVSNAGCADAKCACNADYMAQDGLCASAQSVGISAGVLLMSMLAMAIQKLC